MHTNPQRPRFSILFVSALLVLASGACNGNAVVRDLVPNPRINMEARSERVELQLTDGVRNDFVVHDEVYASDMEVYGWRKSLETAFNNSVKPMFADAGTPTVTLQLGRTELFFDDGDSASAIATGPAGVANVQSIRIACNLQYQAFLLDEQGNRIATDIGQVRYASGDWGREEMVRGAIERMYEQVAKNLLTNIPAPSSGGSNPVVAEPAQPAAVDATAAKAAAPSP